MVILDNDQIIWNFGNISFLETDFMATLFKSSKETLDSLPLQVLEGHFLLVLLSGHNGRQTSVKSSHIGRLKKTSYQSLKNRLLWFGLGCDTWQRNVFPIILFRAQPDSLRHPLLCLGWVEGYWLCLHRHYAIFNASLPNCIFSCIDIHAFWRAWTVTMGRYQILVVCPFVSICLCVLGGTISKFWDVPFSLKCVYASFMPR